MTDSCVLPDFDVDEASEIAQRLFALTGPIKPLDGERDLNFLIGAKDQRHVFKIANAEESPAMLECQHQVFQRLTDARVLPQVATARVSANGKSIEILRSKTGSEHACRALPFIEGRMLADVGSLSPNLLTDLGRQLAKLDRALESFSHPALERPLLWRMDNALDVLESFKPLVKDSSQLDLVEYFESGYRERVLPRLAELRRAVIHNDANRANVLVNESGTEVVSIIDFGDMIETWLVIEPVIAATYVMLEQDDPLAKAAALLRGYQSEIPLQPVEIDLVFDFICMRLCTSICINAHQIALEPDNEYLNVDVGPSRELLLYLREIDPADARALLFPQ
jgi:Ser/Thr protein kinase RdoA (MazF antagonist)